MPKPTRAQLDADIAEFLRTGGMVTTKPRKKGKGKLAVTDIETSSDEVEQAKAAVRSMYKYGNPAAQAEATDGLNRKLRKLATAVGTALGHVVLGQGHSYECARCGASGECGGTGLFDTEPRGAIFREQCQMKGAK
jgi:hypothetical protein